MIEYEHTAAAATGDGLATSSFIREALRRIPWIIAAAIGMWLVFIGTRAGIGTFGDSVTYYTAAKSLMAGTGLQQQAMDGTMMPLIQFPPAYSVLLAGVAKASGDVLGAARAVNVLALGFSIFLVGTLVYRLTRSAFASAMTAVLFAVHGQAIGLCIRMFSEPTYVVLMLCVMAVLIRFGPRGRGLIVAGALAGAAILTRFAGAHLIACCAFWIILMNWRFGWRSALRRAAAFLIPAVLPAVAWSIRNILLSGHSTSRSIAYHPPKWEQITPIFDAMRNWVIPVEGIWQLPAVIVLLVLWLAIPIWTIWKSGLPRSGISGRLMLPVIFVLTYVPFLFVARTFFDSAIPFNYRLLVPIHPLSLVVVAVWLTRRWHAWRGRIALPGWAMAGIIGAGVLAVAAQQVHGSLDFVRRAGMDGLGYATKDWSQSAGIRAIEALPADSVIYTNAADAVYLLSGHQTRPLPFSFGYDRTRGKALVEHGLVRLYRAMSREHAVAVYFTKIKRNTIMVSEKQLVARIHDTRLQQVEDAHIYSIPY